MKSQVWPLPALQSSNFATRNLFKRFFKVVQCWQYILLKLSDGGNISFDGNPLFPVVRSVYNAFTLCSDLSLSKIAFQNSKCFFFKKGYLVNFSSFIISILHYSLMQCPTGRVFQYRVEYWKKYRVAGQVRVG